ncbi:MAG: hypothetical protein E7664_06305 [Ruminococcaceae bacterium]|nr:hypothetical protein [Oscillospiraceae bacterium]
MSDFFYRCFGCRFGDLTYLSCRVKGEEESLLQVRLSLCSATRTVIKNVLDMLKITAPESM